MGRQLSTFLLSIFGKMLQEEVTNVSLLFMESIFQSAEASLYLLNCLHSPVNLAKIVEKILLNTYLFMSNREKTNQIQFHSHGLLWT